MIKPLWSINPFWLVASQVISLKYPSGDTEANCAGRESERDEGKEEEEKEEEE